ncbi:MAG: ribokinase [Spirochaetaceae bacterium]|jgi:ribokinase|nr:ribokinase [Spirochaetaceae bacterium]
MTRILVYGSLNIDMVFAVDHIVLPGETVSSSSFTRNAGGKGANQAAALGKAGMNVFLAGKIGADGKFILPLLGSYGVDTGNVAVYEGATGNALIQVDRNGQNSIVLYPGGNGDISVSEVERVISAFGAGDFLVAQNEIAHTGEIINAAKKRGLKVHFNPSPYDEKVEALPLDNVDCFFVNELEGAALAGLPKDAPPAAALDKLVKRFPKAEIILTAGKNGAYYGQAETREYAAIVDAPVVDTTGAGDTFTGYFLAALVKGMTVRAALETASKASSITVSRRGAMESVPFAVEVFGSRLFHVEGGN